MTTDIVERLRHTAPIVPVCGKAADEIERLRAALDACADYGDKQVAKIERLRDAILKSDDAHWTPAMRAVLREKSND